MPKISSEKQKKIQEQILSHLFNTFPRPLFTADIAKEIARDEEFIKKLLQELHEKGLVILINKNPAGKDYTRRNRWRLSTKAYEIYKKHS